MIIPDKYRESIPAGFSLDNSIAIEIEIEIIIRMHA